jgi:WD40 repeat protein
MASSSSVIHQCLENDDLFKVICSFCNVLDFLSLERVNHHVNHLVRDLYSQVLDGPSYKYLSYKRKVAPTVYTSAKHRVCHLYRNRDKYRGGFLLVGSNFGSIRNATLWIEDNPYELNGKICPDLTESGIVGSTAVAIDSSHSLFLIGGWSDINDEAVEEVRHIALDPCGENSTTSLVPPVRGEVGWKYYGDIDKPRCFPAATSTIDGSILVSGGSDSPYRGADVYDGCIFKRQSDHSWLDNIVKPMIIPRCGHCSLTLTSQKDQVVVIGGYSGDHDYNETCELYDFEKNEWYPLPSMREKRSGAAAVIGPYGSIYVCGGSRDGSLGNNTLERYDPREGKRWELLASMHLFRGYTAGAVGSTGVLYVCGGLHDTSVFQPGMECYDFKTNNWFGLLGTNPTAPYVQFPKGTNWSSVYFNKKKEADLHSDVLAVQLLRASHQLIYVE